MRRRALAACAALSLLGAAAVAALQPALAHDAHQVRVQDDVVWLPRPLELRVLGLGYVAAMVDVLWGKTLVEYGVHVHEKRPFEVERYLDTVLALEPDYLPLFDYVDTLLVYRPPRGHEADARKARAYLEAGTRARPYDHRVWKQYGQFIAYLAPSFLDNPLEIEQWRREGAAALMRAVELGADADSSLAASTLLSRYGERDAAIGHLQRTYAMTDDPELKQQILGKLQRLQVEGVRDELREADRYLEQRRHDDAPAMPRSVYGWLGPMPDPAQCLNDTRSARCAGTLYEAQRRAARERELESQAP